MHDRWPVGSFTDGSILYGGTISDRPYRIADGSYTAGGLSGREVLYCLDHVIILYRYAVIIELDPCWCGHHSEMILAYMIRHSQ